VSLALWHRSITHLPARAWLPLSQIPAEALTGKLDAVIKALEDHYRKSDVIAKGAVAPGVANIDEPLSYAAEGVREAIETAVRGLDDKAKDAQFASLLDEIVSDAKKGSISKGEGYGRRLAVQVLARARPEAVRQCLGKAYTQYGAGHYGSPQVALPAMWAIAQTHDADAAVATEAWAKLMAPAIADPKVDPAVAEFAVAFIELLAKKKPAKCVWRPVVHSACHLIGLH
jgi:hypothetical protein